tara:strand:+ start:24254 stop:24478 length:225 start_codon:yes stop_codon:yes gene_type:complete
MEEEADSGNVKDRQEEMRRRPNKTEPSSQGVQRGSRDIKEEVARDLCAELTERKQELQVQKQLFKELKEEFAML